MRILRNFSLKNYNSFGIDAIAERFVSVESTRDLRNILRKIYASEIFILGGGSNLLLTRNINRTVLHIALKGKKVVSKVDNEVIVEAAAGENWHEFVNWTLKKGFGGLENLSLIPGNVGTSPVQNIGAYGVELKDNFVSCQAINIQTLEEKEFKSGDCDFGYRSSVFKNDLKGRYIITSVRFRLTRNKHFIKTEYGSIQEELKKENILDPQPIDISKAVINIRQSKLPNPKEIGNSGSFFKNPVLSQKTFQKLKHSHPEIPVYKISEDEYKIPAGWLIDQAGLKGYREKDAGVHQRQALVLVNYGDATGEEILLLSQKVQAIVQEKFGIKLEAEVNIIE